MMDAIQDWAVRFGYQMIPPPAVWVLDALLVLCCLVVMWAYYRSWQALWTWWHTLRMLAYAAILLGLSLGAISLYANQQSVPLYRVFLLIGTGLLLTHDGQVAGKRRRFRRTEDGRSLRWWGW